MKHIDISHDTMKQQLWIEIYKESFRRGMLNPKTSADKAIKDFNK